MYADYVAEQPYLDSVFIAHDVDGSARIELGELMPFLKEITGGLGGDVGLADVQFIMESAGHDPHEGAPLRRTTLHRLSRCASRPCTRTLDASS